MSSDGTVPRPPATDSLKKRFGFKLGGNVLGALFSVGTQAMVPRALGPGAYGAYGFLTNFFNYLVSFLDAGTSTGFFTKLSQRPHDRGLIRFYFGLTAAISLGVTAFVAAMLLSGHAGQIWPDQQSRYVWAGLGLMLVTWYSQIIEKVIDAFGLTAPGEVTRVVQKLVALGLVFLLFRAGSLRLGTYFATQTIAVTTGILLWLLVIKRRHAPAPIAEPSLSGREYLREFYTYSSPLFAAGLFALATGASERWMLQRFSGSVEQGFFTLSNQIAALCLLFTSAMSPLLMREFSKAHGQNDRGQMKDLFINYVPVFYSVAAYFSVFLSINANQVGYILGGSAFGGATATIALMSLYPIHQTYGQMSSTVLLATGKTRVYRDLVIAASLVGMAASYVLLAPSGQGGLHLGGFGLALKLVLIQLVSVNLYLVWNARYLKFSFFRLFAHQIYCVLVLGTNALASRYLAAMLSPGHALVSFVVSGAGYTSLCVIEFIFAPALFGVSKERAGRLRTDLRRLWSWSRESTGVSG